MTVFVDTFPPKAPTRSADVERSLVESQLLRLLIKPFLGSGAADVVGLTEATREHHVHDRSQIVGAACFTSVCLSQITEKVLIAQFALISEMSK